MPPDTLPELISISLIKNGMGIFYTLQTQLPWDLTVAFSSLNTVLSSSSIHKYKHVYFLNFW